eukprot:PRCOL_00002549-RA
MGSGGGGGGVVAVAAVGAGAATQSAAPTQGSELPATADAYGGVTVDVSAAGALAADAATFGAALDASLSAWKREAVRGAWLRIGLEHAALVPVAAERAFAFHHAERDFVMMSRWLPEGEVNTLPPAASSHVGVGALVVCEDSVLVVRERRGPAAGRGWKLVTGLAELNEEVDAAAAREVFEETGVRAHFEGVVAMRRALGTHVAQKDDMFFLCVLRAQPEPSAAGSALAPPPVSPCETELEGARWMSAEEFLAGGEGIAHGGHSSEGLWPKLYRDAWRCASGTRPYLHGEAVPVGFRPGEQTVLSAAPLDREHPPAAGAPPC